MSISIRQAGLEDVALLAQLNGAVQRHHHEALPNIYKPAQADDPALLAWFVEQLERPDCVIYIAENEGVAAGYIVCAITQQPETPYRYALKRLHIDQLSVNDDQRRFGVGTALHEKAVTLAKSVNAEQITLGVLAFNEQAIAFYRRHGFEIKTLNMVLTLE